VTPSGATPQPSASRGQAHPSTPPLGHPHEEGGVPTWFTVMLVVAVAVTVTLGWLAQRRDPLRHRRRGRSRVRGTGQGRG
jgi:hypothetical protein